jgi:integrase
MGGLTTAVVKALRTPGKYLDGHGLALHIAPHGGRYWMFRFKQDGRERTMSLGSADVVSLQDARKLHTEARALLAKGIDPLAVREQAKAEKAATVSFSDAAAAYIAAHRLAWRGRGESHWRQSLAMHVLPVFGAKPVGAVTVDDVLKALAPIWTTKTPMARIVRSRIELVLDFARARGWRQGENVATWRGNLRMLLPPPAKVHRVAHHPALDWREAPAFMARLAPETSMAAKCLSLLILTATRAGEARGARWSEIDMGQTLWTIPASRMKASKEHRLPLSAPAMALLAELASLRTGDLVFEGAGRGCEVSNTTLQAVAGRLGYPCVTVHGMRSCFRDWAAERGTPFEVAEAALAHVSGNPVVQAYRRSDLLDARRGLMQQWGEFLTRPPAEVIPLRQAG